LQFLEREDKYVYMSPGVDMKVLMLGWEFPPFISGGLGTACYGLTRAMDQIGIEITFVLPKMIDYKYSTHVKLLNPGTLGATASFKIDVLRNVTFHAIDSALQPYSTPGTYQKQLEDTLKQKQIMFNNTSSFIQSGGGSDYCGDMYTEVNRYAAIAVELARNEDYDIIHAHDWMTFPAAIA